MMDKLPTVSAYPQGGRAATQYSRRDGRTSMASPQR